MNRLLSKGVLISLFILLPAACEQVQTPATEPSPSDTALATEGARPVQTVVPIAGTETAPASSTEPGSSTVQPTGVPLPGATGTSVPVIILPPISLVSPTAGTAVPFKGSISISPSQGAIVTTVVKITITGSGFPAGKSIDISALPELPSGQPQDYDLSQVTTGSDGTFQAVLVMPSDIPAIAEARAVKIIAALSDGSGAASAEFTNTDAK